ncbi:MAG: hypothetical protein LBG43_04150 [Treponema sp.]|nr:hypothetical protein [Treponema sp.]
MAGSKETKGCDDPRSPFQPLMKDREPPQARYDGFTARRALYIHTTCKYIYQAESWNISAIKSGGWTKIADTLRSCKNAR